MRISFTSPDLGGISIPEGTILKFLSFEEDTNPNRAGWVWYNFEVIGRPLCE